jgi:hypothetical protein
VRIAENNGRDNSELKVKNYDTLIMLSYAISSIAFLVLIHAASMSAGTASGEFALMSVFP